MSLPLWSHDLVLLVSSADPVPDDSQVTPGPWMAVLVLGLVVASVLLWFSMRRHLRRIRVPGDESPVSGETRTETGRAQNDRPDGPPVS